MKALPLICHGGGVPVAPLRIDAWVETAPSGLLQFRYALRGDLSRLRLPGRAPAARAEGLWRHTCFEAFLRAGPGPGYLEMNFSPSSCWAIYAFSAYRDGMRSPEVESPPRVSSHVEQGLLQLSAEVPGQGLPLSATGATWRLGLSAVIEDIDGHQTYWALAHPPGKPDFHHDTGFVITMEGNER